MNYVHLLKSSKFFNIQLRNCNFRHISDNFYSCIIHNFDNQNICNFFQNNPSQNRHNHFCVDCCIYCKMISHKNISMRELRSCMIPIGNSFCKLNNQLMNNPSFYFQKVWKRRSRLIPCFMLKQYSCICNLEAFLRGRIKGCCCNKSLSKSLEMHTFSHCNFCMNCSGKMDYIHYMNSHCSLDSNMNICCHKISGCCCSYISYSLLSLMSYTCFAKDCSCDS